jgi:hypothetical protein
MRAKHTRQRGSHQRLCCSERRARGLSEVSRILVGARGDGPALAGAGLKHEGAKEVKDHERRPRMKDEG